MKNLISVLFIKLIFITGACSQHFEFSIKRQRSNKAMIIVNAKLVSEEGFIETGFSEMEFFFRERDTEKIIDFDKPIENLKHFPDLNPGLVLENIDIESEDKNILYHFSIKVFDSESTIKYEAGKEYEVFRVEILNDEKVGSNIELVAKDIYDPYYLNVYGSGRDLVYLESNKLFYGNTFQETNEDQTITYGVSVDDQGSRIAVRSNIEEIEVYPNPTQDIVNVRIPKCNSENECSLKMVNSEHKLIQKETILSENTTIDISTYSKGVYFIILDLNGIETVKKIIKL